MLQEVIAATIDLEDIRLYRNKKRSRAHIGAGRPGYPRIFTDFSLSKERDCMLPTAQPIIWKYRKPEEEVARGIALCMWDILRRSGSGGYFLSLTGGVNSTSAALIIYSMCFLAFDSMQRGSM